MPHWPHAASQFCDPLDICSRELVEDSLVFPERYSHNKFIGKKRKDKLYLYCSDVLQPGIFLSLHLSQWGRHPTLKGYSTKKDLLETHLAADVPPDAIMELIIQIALPLTWTLNKSCYEKPPCCCSLLCSCNNTTWI